MRNPKECFAHSPISSCRNIYYGLNIVVGGRGVGSGPDHPNYGQREKFATIYEKLPDAQKALFHEPYRANKNSSEAATKAAQTRIENGWVSPTQGQPRSTSDKKKISESLQGKNSGPDHYLYSKHITEENRRLISDGRKGKAVGADASNAKLDDDKVHQIKLLLEQGIKGVIIAKQFDITKYTISDIKRGKTWKHVKIER